jgi:hypothetical protein
MPNGTFTTSSTGTGTSISNVFIGPASVSFTLNVTNNNATNQRYIASWGSANGWSGSQEGIVRATTVSFTVTSPFLGNQVEGSAVINRISVAGNNLGTTAINWVTGTPDPPPPPPTFSVANVVGQLNTTAATNLTNAGAGSVTQNFTTTGATSVNNRRVISQDPTAGTTINVGSTVSINSYNYLLQVPSILGLTETAANTALTNAEFLFRTSTLTTTGATVANNLTVSTQTPTGGTQANPLDNVAYTLFNFLTAVPNVLGQQRDTAITNLNNLGFTSITIVPDETGATPENNKTVKSQTPVNSATTFNPANTSVTLTIFDTGIAGRRNTGTGFTELSNAKRYTGSVWSDLTVQKRFDGTVWRDISN